MGTPNTLKSFCICTYSFSIHSNSLLEHFPYEIIHFTNTLSHSCSKSYFICLDIIIYWLWCTLMAFYMCSYLFYVYSELLLNQSTCAPIHSILTLSHSWIILHILLFIVHWLWVTLGAFYICSYWFYVHYEPLGSSIWAYTLSQALYTCLVQAYTHIHKHIACIN